MANENAATETPRTRPTGDARRGPCPAGAHALCRRGDLHRAQARQFASEDVREAIALIRGAVETVSRRLPCSGRGPWFWPARESFLARPGNLGQKPSRFLRSPGELSMGPEVSARLPAPTRWPCWPQSNVRRGSSMGRPLTVVKVGGSLFDLPRLGAHLARWLRRKTRSNCCSIPGGGRDRGRHPCLDRKHRLG